MKEDGSEGESRELHLDFEFGDVAPEVELRLYCFSRFGDLTRHEERRSRLAVDLVLEWV